MNIDAKILNKAPASRISSRISKEKFIMTNSTLCSLLNMRKYVTSTVRFKEKNYIISSISEEKELI